MGFMVFFFRKTLIMAFKFRRKVHASGPWRVSLRSTRESFIIFNLVLGWLDVICCCAECANATHHFRRKLWNRKGPVICLVQAYLTHGPCFRKISYGPLRYADISWTTGRNCIAHRRSYIIHSTVKVKVSETFDKHPWGTLRTTRTWTTLWITGLV